jgi:membrane fusion protein, multidrug efflux system
MKRNADSIEDPRQQTKVTRAGTLLSALVGAISLAACNQAAPPSPPPPPTVAAGHPELQVVENWNEFTGRTAAVSLVNITPRVSGYIVAIPFKEGDLVRAGDLLFQIDPRPYQDAYDQAVGQLERAQAYEKLQDITFERQERLRATGVIAKEDYDTALSNKSTAAGDVIAAQAAVNAAKLNLEFTHVISPIDGRVSRQLVNIGNLVQADSTRLTTVVSIDPIYAYFSMDELAALKFQQLMRDGKLLSSREGKVLVYLQLQDETQFPHQGTIDFSDNAYDTSTGTLLIRGTFANRDGLLTPGNFVRMRVPSSLKYRALLVADRAIGSDQDQSFVYVIDRNNIAQLHHIKTGPLTNGLRVVTSGLRAEDLVVINGIIKVRPGAPVKPEAGSMEQFASSDSSTPLLGTEAGSSEAAGSGRE